MTAVTPANGGTVPEGMLTFDWTDGTDVGSGVDRYDLVVNGTTISTGIAPSTYGTVAVYAGARTWSIRAWDTVGNSTLFPFTFTASVVPDATVPDTFDLLAPADTAAVTTGFELEWEPAWDFYGVTQYRVFIDGSLAGTTAGNVTTFAPAVGAGPAICSIDYDPAPSSGCITGPTYSNGKSSGSAAVLPAPASSTWTTAAQAGWTANGSSFGFGDASVLPVTDPTAGFDGDRVWTAAEYTLSVPADGADLRFEHRYRFHMSGQNGLDGGTIELKVDNEGDGFGNDVWESTCAYESRAVYGSGMNCVHEAMEVDGGYDAVLVGSSASAHPMFHQYAFSGDSGGMVQSKLRLSDFAGMNIQLRFRAGTDSCHSAASAAMQNICTTNGAGNIMRNVWRIDDVTLAQPELLAGPHTWYIEARDAAGNTRQSSQTWTFNLS